ncbi:PREDICTED: high mobility group B protein 6 isoform X2 [Nicotiana attenuata]|uniref:high mobility group B protein 6 isoform X2 n=1 Tax=Nicotiana attenuata TaxID=49451 RepID=UPI0009059540|nr:PREDICTED: high mobility group B protein 6 isoform X2 [Nicotiana attenuata]
MASTAPPSPFPDNQIHRPKSGRKPLQPKNTNTPATPNNHPKPKTLQSIGISLTQNSNKENLHPKGEKLLPCIQAEVPFDSSLAEELSAIREKLERLRIDREKTEKMLKERDLLLDLQMKELFNRGELQKELELEVDRLFRLKELRLSCMKISPIRTLREKEEEKKMNGYQPKELNYDEEDDIRTESSSENDPSAIGNEIIAIVTTH